MPISEAWRTDDTFERHAWSVAQLNAPYSEVLSTFRDTGEFEDTEQAWHGKHFEIADWSRRYLVLFSRSPEWTYIECIRDCLMPYDTMIAASKLLKANVLSTEWDYESGGLSYSHIDCGIVREELTTANDMEGFPLLTVDGKKRKWKSNDAGTVFRFGNRDSQLDLETNSFLDWWNDIADSLTLDVPFLCWTNQSNSELGLAGTEDSDVLHASLLITV